MNDLENIILTLISMVPKGREGIKGHIKHLQLICDGQAHYS
jgi:hypothetical protein